MPLVGALPAFLRQPFDFLLDARARYGDIYTLDLGPARLIVLNHPRHMQHVFVDHAQNYRKGGGFWDAGREVVGNGLVVSEGDFWLRQRRLIQPHFHRKALAGLVDSMVAATDESLDRWYIAAHTGRPFNALPGFATITMRVVGRALFGQGLDRQDLDRATQSMAVVLDHVMVAMLTYGLPRWIPVPGARRFQQAIRELDEVVLRIIAQERQATAPSSSLLGMLVHMRDAETGEGMTDAQIRDEVLTFFLAGYETTSLALTWALQFLTQHPAELRRVVDEVDAALGERAPTFDDLAALSYTRMVIQETLRLRPPAWQVTRTAVADDVIDGYAIPAGANIVPLIYGIHHHPQIWDDPTRFDPERFAPEQAAQRHKLAWAPFGAGQRQCVGKDFAIMEAQIVLAMIVQRYALAAVPGRVATPRLAATLTPKGGVWVSLQPRS
jgi:cytochrome P450